MTTARRAWLIVAAVVVMLVLAGAIGAAAIAGRGADPLASGDAPTEPAYTSGLAGLEATIGSLSDPIADQDDTALLAAIDAMRAEIADLHGIVNTAT